MLTAIAIALLAQNTLAPVRLHVVAGSKPVRLTLDGSVYGFRAEELGEIPTFEGTHLVTLDYGPEAPVWHGWYQFDPGVADLTVWEPAFISGKVLWRGVPVSGVQVHVESDAQVYVADPETLIAPRAELVHFANIGVTNHDGEFEIAVPMKDHYTVSARDEALGWADDMVVAPRDEAVVLELTAGATLSRPSKTAMALQSSIAGATFPLALAQPINGTVVFRNVSPDLGSEAALFRWEEGRWLLEDDRLRHKVESLRPPVKWAEYPARSQPLTELEGLVIDARRRPVLGAAVISRCDPQPRPGDQLRFHDPSDAPARWTYWPQGLECVDAIAHTDGEGHFLLKKKHGVLGWIQLRQGSKRLDLPPTTKSPAAIVFH